MLQGASQEGVQKAVLVETRGGICGPSLESRAVGWERGPGRAAGHRVRARLTSLGWAGLGWAGPSWAMGRELRGYAWVRGADCAAGILGLGCRVVGWSGSGLEPWSACLHEHQRRHKGEGSPWEAGVPCGAQYAAGGAAQSNRQASRQWHVE